MKDATIHAIDRWLGRPLCWLLTATRRFRREPTFPYPPRRVLFLKLVEQGATVLAYGAVRRAVELVGRDNVCFCVFEENRPILDAMEWVPAQNVLSIRGESFGVFLADTLRAIGRCRRLGIDAVIDMEHFARASAILAYLTGAPIRVGLHRYTMEAPYRGDLMTHRLLYNPYLHTARYYDLLVQAMAFPPDSFPMIPVAECDLSMECPQFKGSDEERAALRETLERLAGAPLDGQLVILNPNAADRIPGRKWPLERYVELARRVLDNFPRATLVISGTESERAGAEAIVDQVGACRVIDLAGQTTFRELLTLYTLSTVLVTNDSGPAHFASMTACEVVVLFGPETPALYAPVGPRIHVVYKGLVCTPSVNALNHRVPPPAGETAMAAIGVDEVFAIVAGILEQRNG
jgi:ADP-heptose:LPS heptosyltransferase